jgi:hypothetical protein
MLFETMLFYIYLIIFHIFREIYFSNNASPTIELLPHNVNELFCLAGTCFLFLAQGNTTLQWCDQNFQEIRVRNFRIWLKGNVKTEQKLFMIL